LIQSYFPFTRQTLGSALRNSTHARARSSRHVVTVTNKRTQDTKTHIKYIRLFHVSAS